MFSVALIGPDGAGKTTIARKIQYTSPLPTKYLYMGVSVDSTNVALPTTRLMNRLKKKSQKKKGIESTENVIPPDQKQKNGKKSGRLRAALRLINRLLEEYYRQFLSWKHRRNGYIVLYDRHYKFDYELEKKSAPVRFSDWLHRWCLANLYPRPDVVIYLDAPAEVLFARKGEFTLEWLESRRQSFLRQGSRTPNFFKVDATQPLEMVFQEVESRIMQFYENKKPKLQTVK